MEIHSGALDTKEIFYRWQDEQKDSNYGAGIFFLGTIRDENGIRGLSFDIYEPVLSSWFDSWQNRAKTLGAIVKMAHSQGDVMLHESSYMSAVFSRKRRVALELIDQFVEDFKANAPIWKYDMVNEERVYAANRSKPMDGAGILSAP